MYILFLKSIATPPSSLYSTPSSKSIPLSQVYLSSKAYPSFSKVSPLFLKYPIFLKSIPSSKVYPLLLKSVPPLQKYTPSFSKVYPLLLKSILPLQKYTPSFSKVYPLLLKSIPPLQKYTPSFSKVYPLKVRMLILTLITPHTTRVYSYDSQGQLWQELPDCHSRDSALVMAANKLTTVGGLQGGRPTNSLASLTGEGKDSEWVELFPRMPTARHHLAAVCRGRNVIAAGGQDDGGRRLSTVETLDTDLRQWSSAASLPHPMSVASITVCEDLLYLLGGFDQNDHRTLSVLTSSITDLLHQQQETANQPAVWRRDADAPYYWSTAVSVGGQLLAIGGKDEAWKKTSAIVAYDPTSDSWQDMGHMTTPRSWPLVALLPSNQLIVAGGWGVGTKVEIGNVV